MPAAAATVRLTAAHSGPAYDVVLLLHVAAAVVSLGAVVVGGIQAARLRRVPVAGPVPPTLATYYAPGVNWAGRVLYAVPLLGVALIALSHGAFGFDDRWIQVGLGLWAAAAVGAEAALWPAERQIQRGVAAGGVPEPARRACARVAVASVVLSGLLVAAVVVMVARP